MYGFFTNPRYYFSRLMTVMREKARWFKARFNRAAAVPPFKRPKRTPRNVRLAMLPPPPQELAAANEKEVA